MRFNGLASAFKALQYTLILACLAAGATFLSATSAHAAAGINQQVNFQARLLNAAGATVPDGNYNIQFKIYQDGDGCVPGGSVATPCGGTLKWTEDWLNNNSKGVTVKNGYFSVYLGSVNTSLNSLVDFNQDGLWLSLNVGSTNGTCATFSVCGGDGEMLPFKRFAASPYALNSNKLGGLTSTQFLQLAQGVQTDSSTSNASIFVNKTGTTADIINLQRGGTTIFKIANGGATTFRNTTDSSSGFLIQNTSNVDLFKVDTSTPKVTVGTDLDITGKLSVNATSSNTSTPSTISFTIAPGSAWRLGGNDSGNINDGIQGGYGQQTQLYGYWGIVLSGNRQAGSPSFVGGSAGDANVTIETSSNARRLLVLQGASGQSADILQVKADTSLLTSISGTGAALFQNTTDSASAFVVQNASSKTVFTADTSAGKIILGHSSSGGVNGSMVFKNTTNTNTAAISTGVTSTSYNLTLPTALPGSTQCITSTSVGVLAFSACGGGGGSSTLATAYSGGASSADSTITLDNTRSGVIIQDASTPISGNLFTVQKNGGGASYLGLSTSALTLQDTSGNNALAFDSTNSILKVYEDTTSPSNFAQIYYASGEAVFAASSGTTRVGNGSGNITMSLTNAGDLLTFNHAATLSGAYNSTDFKITRTLAAGNNAATGSVLKIEDLSSFTGGSSSPDVLVVNQNNSGAGGNLINAQYAGASKFSVTTGGSVSIASGQSYTGAGAVTVASASSTALTLQGPSGISLVSSGGNITIGTSDTTGTLLVLDDKTGVGDPTGVNGGTYYNSGEGKFRCYENGVWKNCVNQWTDIVKSADQTVTNNATPQDDTELQFAVAANTTYVVQFNIIYGGNNATSDYRWRFTYPTIGNINSANGYDDSGTAAAPPVTTTITNAAGSTTQWPTADRLPGTDAANTPFVFQGQFMFRNTTAGTVKFQFANSAAAATRTSTTFAGSTITYKALK